MAASRQSVFVYNFVKTKADAKSFVWNFFGNLFNKAGGPVTHLNTVYCNNGFENSEIKAYKDIVSTTINILAQHFRDCQDLYIYIYIYLFIYSH